MTARFRLPVLLFGRHREMAGESIVEVDLAVGATVGDLRAALARHPRLGATLGGAAVAVNRRYRADDAQVADGDEVAIIPPVAGG